jgi:hypothetical protein
MSGVVMQGGTRAVMRDDGFTVIEQSDSRAVVNIGKHAISSEPEKVMKTFREYCDSKPVPSTIQGFSDLMTEIMKEMNKLDQNRGANSRIFTFERIADIRGGLVEKYVQQGGEIGKIPTYEEHKKYNDSLKELAREEVERYKLVYSERLEGTKVVDLLCGEKSLSAFVDDFELSIEEGSLQPDGTFDIIKALAKGEGVRNYGRVNLDLPTPSRTKHDKIENGAKRKLTKNRSRLFIASFEDYYSGILRTMKQLNHPLMEVGFRGQPELSLEVMEKKFPGEKNPIFSFCKGLEDGTKIRHINLENLSNGIFLARGQGSRSKLIGELQQTTLRILKAISKSESTKSHLERLYLPVELVLNDEILEVFCDILESSEHMRGIKLSGLARRTVNYKSPKLLGPHATWGRSEEFSLNVSENCFSRLNEVISGSSLVDIDLSGQPVREENPQKREKVLYLSTTPRSSLGDDFGETLLNSVLRAIQGTEDGDGTHINRLVVSWNNLGKKSAEVLEKIVSEKNADQLTHIDFSGNNIIGASFAHLISPVGKNNAIMYANHEDNASAYVSHPHLLCLPICHLYSVGEQYPAGDDQQTLKLRVLANKAKKYALRILINVQSQSQFVSAEENKLLETANRLRESAKRLEREQQDAKHRKEIELRQASATHIQLNQLSSALGQDQNQTRPLAIEQGEASI